MVAVGDSSRAAARCPSGWRASLSGYWVSRRPNSAVHYFLEEKQILCPRKIVGTRSMRIGMVGIIELDDFEAASVYVEVDVPLLKVWRDGVPDARLRISSFNGGPGIPTDAGPVLTRLDEKQIERVLVGCWVDRQDAPTYMILIAQYA